MLFTTEFISLGALAAAAFEAAAAGVDCAIVRVSSTTNAQQAQSVQSNVLDMESQGIVQDDGLTLLPYGFDPVW